MKARKLIAMLLVVATLMSFAPMAVFAADDTAVNKIVTVQYLFEDGKIAADPWTASIAAGEDLTQTITYPTIVGYEVSSSKSTVGDGAQVTWGADALELNVNDITGDITITVVYVPALVNYTVEFYQQNVDNDNYALAETVTMTGYTGSKVSITADKYAGFYELPYDKDTVIAADGSTKVEVYYDREYYLLTFDLGGGYGVDPQFLRYGAPVEEVGTPVRPGFTFKGWDQDVPATMPAANTKLTAIWEAVDVATITVVYWGENPNDEEYSYIDSVEVEVAPGTVVGSNGLGFCGQVEHIHTDCTLADHTHGNDCCTVAEHTHSTACCNRGSYHSYHTCNTSNCNNQTEHTHGDGNCVYSASCYSCGKTEHIHTNACMHNNVTAADDTALSDTTLWTYVKSDTASVAADGTTVINMFFDRTYFNIDFYDGSTKVYTINEKWGADISDHWPIVGTNGTTYDNGERWDDEGTTDLYSEVLVFIAIMPADSFELYKNTSSYSTKTMNYMVEALPDAAYTATYTYNSTTKYFNAAFDAIKAKYGMFTEAEDFFPLEGFTKWTSNPKYSSGQITNKTEVTHYYTRNSYTLDFHNGSDVVKSESVLYQANLGTYDDFIPSVPDYLEEGAYTFGGWYQNPECTGNEVVLSETTMPASNMIVYAKWNPITHDVKVYKDNTMTEQIGTTQTVSHRDFATAPTTPTNGQYTFVGWFYLDNGVEKAFDFESMPITKDMDIYAKWSSKTLVPYMIHYQLAAGTVIANPTTGNILGGLTKTFDAKGGEELYTAYQVGYFPQTPSHSLTANLDATTDANNNGVMDANEYIFIYVQKDAVPYTVKYLDAETGEAVADEKYVEDNRYAVVTETAANVNDYLPDAFQKRLIVTDGGENVLIFYYTKDKTHALVTEQHIQVNGSIETEYSSGQITGEIGKSYAETKYNDGHIPGYVFDHATVSYYDADGNLVEEAYTSGTELKLTAGGLHFKFYYRYNRFDVYYQSTKAAVTYDMVDTFSVTDKVHTGYLYGGMYTDASFTTPIQGDGDTTNDDLNGLSFNPVAGATYYVKEVDNRYLRTGMYRVWDTRDDSLYRLYLITGVDNEQYLDVGVCLNGEDHSTDTVDEDDNVNVNKLNSEDSIHSTFTVKFLNKDYKDKNKDYTATSYGVNDFFKGNGNDLTGYLYIHDFSDFVDDVGASVDFRSFYVTPDGVRVEGVKIRHLVNVDGTNTNLGKEQSDVASECRPASEEAVTMAFAPLMMRSSYSVFGHVVDHTITKIDGDITELQTVEPGDNTGAITYTEKEGYIFAGWYTDEACTVAADFSDVQDDMTVYAKYISAKKVNVSMTSVGKYMTATVTVPGTDVPAIGVNYTFNGETTEVACKKYNGILSAIAKLLGSKSETYTASWNMNKLTNGDTFTATAYWTTEDGTVVEIETGSFICSRNRISQQ